MNQPNWERFCAVLAEGRRILYHRHFPDWTLGQVTLIDVAADPEHPDKLPGLFLELTCSMHWGRHALARIESLERSLRAAQQRADRLEDQLYQDGHTKCEAPECDEWCHVSDTDDMGRCPECAHRQTPAAIDDENRALLAEYRAGLGVKTEGL